jgi:hypothetical protein
MGIFPAELYVFLYIGLILCRIQRKIHHLFSYLADFERNFIKFEENLEKSLDKEKIPWYYAYI